MENVKRNLAAGITRVKWIAGFLAERAKAETSIAKLLYQSSKIESKIEDRYRDIGRRVAELGEKGAREEKDIFQDTLILQALDEVRKLREAQGNYKHKARNISKVPE